MKRITGDCSKSYRRPKFPRRKMMGGIAECHRENRNDQLPGMPERTNPSIKAQGHLRKENSGYDSRAAISLRIMRLAILPLGVPLESPTSQSGHDVLIRAASLRCALSAEMMLTTDSTNSCFLNCPLDWGGMTYLSGSSYLLLRARQQRSIPLGEYR